MFKATEEVVEDDVHPRINLYDHGFLLTIKTDAGSFPHAQLNRKVSLTNLDITGMVKTSHTETRRHKDHKGDSWSKWTNAFLQDELDGI